jgi:DNA ligase (NAD+)
MIAEVEVLAASKYEKIDWSKVSIQKRKKLFLKARDWYYNSPTGKTLMSDSAFDALEDSIKDEEPNWSGLKQTGIKVKKKPIHLPVPMPSLNKWKPHNVESWLERAEAAKTLIARKLDGTSLELGFDKGLPEFLYTRGDGITGQDVSFMIPHLQIPKKISYKKKLILRCEGIFTRAAFSKHKNDFTSARSAASGVMNRTSDKIHMAVGDLDIIVLLVLNPWVEPSKGLAYAKKLGFHVVRHKSIPTNKLNAAKMSKILGKQRKKSKHEMDGLVAMWDKINPKPTGEKPAWAIAFKEETALEDAPIATIKYVQWNPSPNGRLIPKAILEPTVFEGITVKQATLNNAAWMRERGIGPGAKVRLVRGGDIIPKIIGVEKAVKPQMPPADLGKWEWDKNQTHIHLVNADENREVNIKRITRFFAKMDVDFIKSGTVEKLYDAGYNKVKKILALEPEDIMKVEGFKDTSANKLYDSIQTLFSEGNFMPKIMEASGLFPAGLGDRRIKRIQDVYPDLLGLADYPRKELQQMIEEIPQFKETTAEMFVEGIYDFCKWFEKSGIRIKKQQKVKLASKKLQGMGITWTSYRDSDQEEIVKQNGGQVVSFGGSTSVLLYSLSGKPSGKIDKAKARGIPVMTWDKFEKKYL